MEAIQASYGSDSDSETDSTKHEHATCEGGSVSVTSETNDDILAGKSCEVIRQGVTSKSDEHEVHDYEDTSRCLDVQSKGVGPMRVSTIGVTSKSVESRHDSQDIKDYTDRQFKEQSEELLGEFGDENKGNDNCDDNEIVNCDQRSVVSNDLSEVCYEEVSGDIVNIVEHGADLSDRSRVVDEASGVTTDAVDTATDFFCLADDDDDNLVDEPIQEHVAVKRERVTVQGEGVNVEIPNTGFWAELNTADLQSYQTSTTTDRQLDRQRKKFKGREDKRTFDERVSNDSKTQGNSISDNQVNYRQSLNYDQGQERGTLMQNDSSHGHTTVISTTANQTQSSRKLFYVHSKIKPFLHANSRNNAPSKLEWTGPAHAGAINRVKWNVPQYSHIMATCSMDSTVKLWNIWTQLDPCLSVLRVHDRAVRDLDWNQAGKQLLTCSYDKTAKVTDVEKGVSIHSLHHDSFVSCGKFHLGVPTLCVTGEKDKIRTWDLRTPGSAVKTFSFKDPMGQIQDVVYSQDQTTLFSCSDLISRDSSDRNMVAWDVNTGAPLSNQIYQERYTLTRLKVHPVDKTLLAQSYGNYVAMFKSDRPYKMLKNKRFEGHKLLGYSIGFDIMRDGCNIYSGSSDGSIHCYDYQTGKNFRTLKTGLNVVMDLACHPVLTSTVALCGWDGHLQVWK